MKETISIRLPKETFEESKQTISKIEANFKSVQEYLESHGLSGLSESNFEIIRYKEADERLNWNTHVILCDGIVVAMTSGFAGRRSSVDGEHSPWNQYAGESQSAGRLIHYVYNYLGYNYAERMTIASSSLIKFGDTEIAEVNWTKGYPCFKFKNLSEDLMWLAHNKQDLLLNNRLK